MFTVSFSCRRSSSGLLRSHRSTTDRPVGWLLLTTEALSGRAARGRARQVGGTAAVGRVRRNARSGSEAQTEGLLRHRRDAGSHRHRRMLRRRRRPRWQQLSLRRPQRINMASAAVVWCSSRLLQLVSTRAIPTTTRSEASLTDWLCFQRRLGRTQRRQRRQQRLRRKRRCCGRSKCHLANR